jgi:hypothetical protein
MDPYYGKDIDFGQMTMQGMYRTPGTTKDAFGSALLLHVGQLQGFKGGNEGHTFDVRSLRERRRLAAKTINERRKQIAHFMDAP